MHFSIRLGKPATKDTNVNLQYSNPLLRGPASVTVRAGEDQVAFDVRAEYVSSLARGTVTASQGDQKSTVDLTIETFEVTYFSSSPSCNWGELVSATLNLNAVVLKSTTFKVNSADPSRIAPFTISVPANSSQGMGTQLCRSDITSISTYSTPTPPDKVVNPRVALYAEVSPLKVARVEVHGPIFDSVFPVSGNTVSAYLRIPVAVAEDRVFTLSSISNITVPANVTIRAGKTVAKFSVVGSPGGSRDFQIQANNALAKATIRGTIDDVRYYSQFNRLRVVGGSSDALTITVFLKDGPINSDAVIELRFEKPLVADLPTSVTIPAGKTSATETMTHHVTTKTEVVRIWVNRLSQNKVDPVVIQTH